MRKNLYPIYIFIFFALTVLLTFPKHVQNTFRNQFIKPFIPFSYLIPRSTPPQIITSLRDLKILNDPPLKPTFENSVIAKIIYRCPATWNDFFWINVGKKSNVTLNSPVLYQGVLVGMIDYIGANQSRVQLISSYQSCISVRVLRGQDQYLFLKQKIEELKSYQVVKENEALMNELSELELKVSKSSRNWYLAKGEIQGGGLPMWRSESKLLMGKGFNYDSADEYGAARELVTNPNLEDTAIIEPDDLLVTTGFDGIFPKNIPVARVSSIEDLNEGSCYYNLRALPLIDQLNDLHQVEIIEPLNYSFEKVEYPLIKD